MKKFFVIMFTALFVFRTGNILSYSYACDTPSVTTDEIDLSGTLLKKMWVDQDFKNKHVSVIRYEAITRLPSMLQQKMKNRIEEAIRAENQKINEDTVQLMWKGIWSFISRDFDTKKAEKSFKEKFGTESVKLLSNEEFDKNVKIGLAKTAVKSGLVVFAEVADVAAKFAIKGASSGLGWAIGFAVLDSIAVGINNWYYTRVSDSLKNEVKKLKNLYIGVMELIADHQWMGNNLLLLATSTKNDCLDTYANFEYVDKLKYKELPNEINENFATAECRILGYYNDDDCEKKALDAINCNWKKKSYPNALIACPKNPYVKKAFDDLYLTNEKQEL